MRSLTLDRLQNDVLAMLQHLGNATANAVYEADLHVMSGWARPSQHATAVEELKRYIRAKYEHRGFVDQVDRTVLLEKLIAASGTNDIGAMLYCVAHGVDMNGVGQDGGTALHIACAQNHVEALTFGILNGGEIEMLNREGLSCLDVAMVNGHTEAMEVCLSRMKTPARSLPMPAVVQ